MLVRVDICASDAGVLVVSVSHHTGGFAPYRLDNCSPETLHLRCVGCFCGTKMWQWLSTLCFHAVQKIVFSTFCSMQIPCCRNPSVKLYAACRLLEQMSRQHLHQATNIHCWRHISVLMLHTCHPLRRQQGCEEAEDVLRPYSSLAYAWDEPALPHRLLLALPGNRLLGAYDLDKARAPCLPEAFGVAIYTSYSCLSYCKILFYGYAWGYNFKSLQREPCRPMPAL